MDHHSIVSRPFTLFALAFAAIAFALAGWTAKSEALNYCVPSMVGGCDQNFSTIQGALDQAASNPGLDEVSIETGSYSGNLRYDGTDPGNAVHIRGMGHNPAETSLTMVSTPGMPEGLYVSAAAGSSITNLSLTVPANADDQGDTGISAHGAHDGALIVDHVLVDGPDAGNASGIHCGFCEVRNSTVDMAHDPVDGGNTGISQRDGPTVIANSDITADYGFVHSSPGLASTIAHSRIKAHIGASTDGGAIDISDSLIQLDDQNGAIGLNFHNYNMGVSELGGDVDGVTIVNGVDNAFLQSTGLAAVADSPQEQVDVTLTNSVLSGFNNFPTGATLKLGVDQGGVLNFDTSYSAYDNGMTAQSYDGDGSNFHYAIGDGHIDLENGPAYVDAANGDFTPAAGSDLVDAGDPADPAPGATDLAGNPRACHGTDSGLIRRDIGAFERVVVAGDDCTYPDTSISNGPEAYPPAEYTSDKAQFTLASTKADSTFLCSIDGDAFAACGSSFTSPALGEGPHTFAFKAVDGFGNIDQSPVERTVYLGAKKGHPPTCEDDPSLCPHPDTTAPKILGLKAPKKTKAARVKVRFRSDEQGVTFTCKLNKGKARKCKSPWKTPKLKKGKNTITIQATDRAGNRSKPVKRIIKRVVRHEAKHPEFTRTR